ncbi:MAG: hypothetical protein B7Z74_07070, partial [Deltaproteobacteria bacterium 21-66-5]
PSGRGQGEGFQPTCGLIVAKEKIAANGDYNLSGERYRENGTRASNYPLVDIQEVAEVASGFGFPLDQQGKPDQDIPFLKVSDMNLPGNEIRITSWNNTVSREILRQLGAKSFPKGTVIFPKIGAAIATNKKRILSCESTYDNNVMGIVPGERLVSEFLYALLQALDLSAWASDSQPPSMRKSVVEVHKIPLPPLEVQKEIVAEIDGYQNVINGARAVLDHYRPHIPINPDWPMVSLGEAADFTSGYAFKSTDMTATSLNDTYRRVVKIGNVGRDGQLDMAGAQFHEYSADLARFVLRIGDVVMAMTGATVGKVAVVKEDGLLLNQRVGDLRAKPAALQSYVLHLLCSGSFYDFCQRTAGGGAQGNIAPREILEYPIPLPPLATQQAIVAEIEAEQALVAANRELIARFEKKIQATLARVLGEDEPAPVEA